MSSRPAATAGRSWWLDDAMRGVPARPALAGDRRADVCIVGGGYTGLWTALAIKERDPSIDVDIVEAGVCGSGASGRNGGFGLTMWHHFRGLQGVCGDEEALRIGRASAAAVAEIGRFCDENGIAADVRADGWLWTATNDRQRGAWQSTVDALTRFGERPFTEIADSELLRRRTGSSRHLAGVFEAAAVTLHPGRLVTGLARVAAERGVAIFEHSPMVALDRGARLCVRTPAGRILADRVVIAMNAWGAKLRELRRAFVIVASDVVMTTPAPDVLGALGWSDGMGISDSRLMVHYYRTTPEGRVLFGKGGCALAFGNRAGLSARPARARRVAARLHDVYPLLAQQPLEGWWSGPIDRPMDGLPFFTTLGRPDLVAGMGYAGNGVAPSLLGGRILASLALGLDDEWSRCGLVRPAPGGLPPEPLRYVGGQIVRRAVARKEAAEDAGRPARRVDAALASLAPAGLVPLE